MTDPLDAECLFAAIGLEPMLRAHPTLHKYQLTKAADLPKEIRRRLARFLATDTFSEAADVPPFDYQKTVALIPPQQTPDQAHAVAAAVPDRELATDLGIQLNRILAWANPLIPRETRLSVRGPRPEEPDTETLADFRRAWQVAADPMIVVDDLEDGSLSDDQVAVLALLYPALYQEMRQALSDAMAQVAARKGKDWEPSAQKAALIGTLKQEDASDRELAATIQGVYAKGQQAAPAPPRRKRSKAGDAMDALTPGQKAAGG